MQRNFLHMDIEGPYTVILKARA